MSHLTEQLDSRWQGSVRGASLTTTNPALSPMMAQYMDLKSKHPDALLFFRMGDFYEMFFDDASAAAEALDIALTKRGKHLGKGVPMCGVPVHAAEGYLQTLIAPIPVRSATPVAVLGGFPAA